MAAASSSVSKSLKEYLKRYESKEEEENKKKKKKKKVVHSKPDSRGVLVVDEDPVWQKPVNLEEENENDSAGKISYIVFFSRMLRFHFKFRVLLSYNEHVLSFYVDEEKPQVDEDIEVKRMRRLEQLRAMRAYNAISEDGSGWVSLSPKHVNSDMSPPRKQRWQSDTPSMEAELNPLHSSRENANLSPPRQPPKHHSTQSPELDMKHAYSTGLNSDMSPPRKQRVWNDTAPPEPRAKASVSGKEDSDLSPPRQRQRGLHTPLTVSDVKLPHFSILNSNLSPSQRLQQLAGNDSRNHKATAFPRHGSLNHDDFRVSLESDLSPQRTSREDVGRHGTPDLSPPRRRGTETGSSHATLLPDLSPPRKSRKEAAGKEQQKTGLLSGKDISEEIARTKKNDWLR